MINQINPYKSPAFEAVPVPEAAGGPVLTENMIMSLKGTSPWLRFLGILGFVGAAFLLFNGILVTIGFVSTDSAAWNMESTMGSLGIHSLVLFGKTIGILCILSAVVCFILARFMYKSGAKIRNYTLTNNINDLEEALKNNHYYWKFYGILTILSIVTIPALLIISGILIALGIVG
ncbi:MAG: DUF5362 family protein [Spirochaetaceae bacterium]|jgi:hypothetical protein|nr:DUF5362 family protein [Spirochaetaceae bacterium]